MEDVFGWATIAFIVAIGPVLLIWGVAQVFSQRPLETKYTGSGLGGLGGAFDAVWSPSAAEAGAERDRQHRRTAPAPSPGDPPDLAQNGRIIITPPDAERAVG
ncbi:hypothetical protein ACFU0W_01370 [Microbacterium keratanolyticum]|uniref:hypothetical protein n=1 Tax=Microbacterium keratanolyticum TaxID=67574 RepID=UPI003672DF9E